MRNPSKNTLKRVIKLLGDNPKKELPYREWKATRHGRFTLHNGKITFKLGNLNYGVPNYEFLFGK